jgi:hypothetical protein
LFLSYNFEVKVCVDCFEVKVCVIDDGGEEAVFCTLAVTPN